LWPWPSINCSSTASSFALAGELGTDSFLGSNANPNVLRSVTRTSLDGIVECASLTLEFSCSFVSFGRTVDVYASIGKPPVSERA
jgi:hypothetical protein